MLYTREKAEKVYKPTQSTGDEGIRVDLVVYQGSYECFNPTQKNTGFITCEFCRDVYKKQTRHAFEKCCSKCRYPLKKCSRSQLSYTKECETCHRMFYSEICFLNHRKKFKNSDAARGVFQKCLKCEKQYSTWNGEHECRVQYCDTCHGRQPIFHQRCWIPPIEKAIAKLKEKEKEYKLVIFDCETLQTHTRNDVDCFLPQHFVCFLYYSPLCHVCIEFKDSFNEDCENCGPHKRGYIRHYKGEPRNIVVQKFVDLLITKRSWNQSIVIGRNAGRFDYHFLIPEILRQVKKVKLNVIKKGNNLFKWILLVLRKTFTILSNFATHTSI